MPEAVAFGPKATAFETFINLKIRTFYRRYRYETCSKLNGGSENVIENVKKWPEMAGNWPGTTHKFMKFGEF